MLSLHLLSLSNMGNLHNLLQVINERVSFINPAKIEGVIKNARARKAQHIQYVHKSLTL